MNERKYHFTTTQLKVLYLHLMLYISLEAYYKLDGREDEFDSMIKSLVDEIDKKPIEEITKFVELFFERMK